MPIYSYDEGIQTLKTAPLTEIDRLAEEFAMGDFEVSGRGDRKEFYQLQSDISFNEVVLDLGTSQPSAMTVNMNGKFSVDESKTIDSRFAAVISN